MTQRFRDSRAFTIAVGLCLAAGSGAVVAQQDRKGPVAAMFGDDQKRDASLAASFAAASLPATAAAAFPLQVYLSAGDLERAFDKPAFRPNAVIIPTNTDLQMTAPVPATQQVLIGRVRKQAEVMRALESQVAARRKQPAPADSREPGVLRIGVDTFVAPLARGPAAGKGTLPDAACFVATEFPDGGAVDRRELFTQDRMRRGIAACLAALDGPGAQSIVMPLMGAASSRTQANDAEFEGQRTLKECRLINSTAGIALGIHDFAASRRTLREVGVIQWDQEIVGMFKVPAGARAERSAQTAYRAYADQVKDAFRKGLSGQKTTAEDLKGSCSGILNAQ
jgi:hypothetical protein